jgi:hypothetical protein
MAAIAKRPVGRPEIYSDELAETILEHVANGVAVRNLTSEDHGARANTVLLWARQYPEFARQLAIARETAAHMIADEGLAIADDDSRDSIDGLPNHTAVQRDRLRADYRKWLAGKWNAAAYADKQVHTGPDGQSAIQIEHTYRFENLDHEELLTLRRLLQKARGTLIEG